MSFDLGSAHGSIRIDAEPKGIDSMKRALTGLETKAAETSAKVRRSFEDVGRTLTSVGQKMSLAITTPAIFAAGASLKAASDLVEAQSAVNTIFAEGAAQVQAFGQAAAVNLGLSRAAALNAAVAFAGMGQAAGLTGKELASFSTQLETNAADLASFFNQDPGEMMDRLRSGLAGEAEPLRRFGILISEARVEQKALQLGLADTSAELTDQQKILARYAIIQEDMGAAMGDRARTADQFAGSLRTLQASTADLAAEMGTTLIPAASAAVKGLTVAAQALNAMPEPARLAVVGVVGLAAVMGPAAIVAGQLAIAITALNAATIAGTPALIALGAVLGPIAAILAGGAVVTILAKGIIETRDAAEEAKDPIDSLTDSIVKMGDAAEDAAMKKIALDVADAWAVAAEKGKEAQEAFDAALAAPGAPNSIESPFGAGANEDTAQQILDNAAAATEAADKYGQWALSTAELAEAERILSNLHHSGHADRVALNRDAAEAVQAYVDQEIGADELLTKLRDLNTANSNLAGAFAASGDAAKATTDEIDVQAQRVAALARANSEAWSGASNALLGINAENAVAEERAKAAADAFFDEARAATALALASAAAARTAVAGTTWSPTSITPDQADANAAGLARASAARVDQREAEQERVRQLEEQTADEIQRINEDLTATLKGLDDQREANNRNMQRSLVVNERDTAQQIRQLEGQRTEAIAAANEQLAGIAEQRAENEQALQEGLVQAQEDANAAIAEIAEQRVEIQKNAAKQMVEAERAATDALEALADRRKDIDQGAAESLADSRKQAAEALADLVDRQVDIQNTLRDSLKDAQEQYNDTLKDIVDAQAGVRENLHEQLKDLTKAWRQQERDLSSAAAEIRADLAASLAETDAAWDEINNKNIRAQQELRGELQNTLEQNALNAKQLQDDLARVQADPTFTASEKDDARFRTERALEALALDRQIAERDAAHDIADLEAERRDQQAQYETERANEIAQAERDLAKLNQRRMDDEQAYHDRRLELERDAAEQIRELNKRRRDAVKDLAEAEAEAHKTANEAIAALAKQRTGILKDAADRERDIQDNTRDQYRDLAADQVEIERNLASKQREIRGDTATRLAELVKREGDAYQTLADRQQTLRDDAVKAEQALAKTVAGINSDLAGRLAAIEHDKEIATRNGAHARELILRDHANTATTIAREQGAAENAALKASLEAQRKLRDTIATENLTRARAQGDAIGKATGDGEVAGIGSKTIAIKAAGAAAGAALVEGVGTALAALKILAENMASTLIKALQDKAAALAAAGAAAAAAAAKGAHDEAKAKSPSKVWQDLGRNMRLSLATELSRGNEPEAAARSAVSRATKAATAEFNRRRMVEGSWFAEADQARAQQQRSMTMTRDGQAANLDSRPVLVQLQMDRRVLDEVVVDIGVRGMRNALQKNPLQRRRP